MIPEVKREVIDLGDGRTISIETGKLAKQAHGSVVVQMGDAMLLCTVVSSYTPTTADFSRLPLTTVKNLPLPDAIQADFLNEKPAPAMAKCSQCELWTACSVLCFHLTTGMKHR